MYVKVAPLVERKWHLQSKQKAFLEDLKAKFNISEPKDWGRIKTLDITQHGGSYLLSLHKNSLFNWLQSIYQGKPY